MGKIISGRYKLVEELGSGGMGVVYRAEQLKPLERSVALKIIKLGMDTQQVIARFEAERQALAVMDHPHIAKVYDAGSTEEGRLFFVMELVRGLPITKYCDKHKLTTEERLEIFIPLCHAVQHAHQKGVIHRDLKPSNVIVTVQESGPVPKIIDFGIAKATGHRLTERTLFTEQGLLIGTPEYMSPEQAEMSGLDVDTRTDIYSLGIILYELLVGELPFDSQKLREAGYAEIQRIIREVEPPKASTRLSKLGDTGIDIASQRRTDPTTLLRELRGDLDWIAMKAMAKDRTRRYASASELAADLDKHKRHEPVSASPPSAAYRIRKYFRRHKTGVAAAAMVLTALIIGIIGTGMGLIKAKHAEQKAVQEAETNKQITNFLVDLFKVSDPGESRGNSVTAREILDKGARKIDEELEDQPLVKAKLMDTMGWVYHNLGLYREAQSLLEKALALREQILGGESQEVAETLTTLGNVLDSSGDFDAALNLHERALALKEKIFGPEHQTVASSLNNLANVHQVIGDYETSKQLYEQAIKVWSNVEGPDCVELVSPLNNLGLLLYEMGDYEAARAMLERCLDLKEKTMGPDHPDIASTLHNLGILLSRIGERDAAKNSYERAVSLHEKTLGPDHPNLAQAIQSLAIFHAQAREFEEARKLFERVLDIERKALGEDHPRVASAITNLGVLRAEMGDFEGARPLLEKGMAMKEKILGSEHPVVANDKNNLASLCVDMGDLTSAKRLFEETLAIREKALGPDHPDVASTLRGLSHVLLELDEIQAAGPLIERALEILEIALGPDHPTLARTLSLRADWLMMQEEYEDAYAVWEREMVILEKVFGPDHPDLGECLDGLAHVCCELRDFEQADKLFARSLAIQEKKLGPEHPQVVETLEKYVEMLRRSGQDNRAEELERRIKKQMNP